MKYSYLKFFVIFFIFLFCSHSIHAVNTIEDQVFTIRNISVDIYSNTSEQARDIALEEAQIKGFNKLMNKMLLKIRNIIILSCYILNKRELNII